MAFPEDFVWGVATAAYQIEGAASADGRTPSVWDDFCRQPGAVFEGHTGEVACDHYHRYTEDVALMADLGVKAYRFSIAWPRVMPEGDGKPNEVGLGFYDRLVDALLAHGIEPWVTLFHWDYPAALLRRGGWLQRESIAWFARFTEVVARRLGDRVRYWLTLNEPQCFLGLGHSAGVHAPGLRYGTRDLLRATHHVLLAHGNAVRIIRQTASRTPRIGWALYGSVCQPAGAADRHVEAARKATFRVPEGPAWYFNNPWYLDPVILGRYPEDGLNRFGAEMPEGFENDLEHIAQPLDFLGLNFYQGQPVLADDEGEPVPVKRPLGSAHTMCQWPVEPEIMYWGPRFFHERYHLPIHITENGCASMDWIHQDGQVHDAPRIDFVARHLAALRRAIDDGADVRGYFHWSLLDNFEWAEGYRMRFGLIYVDYETQERIPKDSYVWYQQVAFSNGSCLPEHAVPLHRDRPGDDGCLLAAPTAGIPRTSDARLAVRGESP